MLVVGCWLLDVGCSLQLAYKNMRVPWNQNRTLPDNFPAYLLRTHSAVPATQQQKLDDTMGLGATGVFDTHPSQGDRIRRARQAAEPGIFHLDGLASALFAKFEIPARQVTLLQYSDDLGIPIIAAKLAPENPSTHATDEPAPAAESAPQPQAAASRLRVRVKPPA
jgi:hypothetical protein